MWLRSRELIERGVMGMETSVGRKRWVIASSTACNVRLCSQTFGVQEVCVPFLTFYLSVHFLKQVFISSQSQILSAPGSPSSFFAGKWFSFSLRFSPFEFAWLCPFIASFILMLYPNHSFSHQSLSSSIISSASKCR